MNKNILIGVVGAVLVAGIAFWGGVSYGKSGAPARGQFGNGQPVAMGGGQFQGGGMRGGMAGGLTAGEIISKDDTSITIKMPDGSTKIVLMGASTQVSKMAEGSTEDLSIGTNVSVTGTTNSDGSVTGQSVQIRPAGMGLPQR